MSYESEVREISVSLERIVNNLSDISDSLQELIRVLENIEYQIEAGRNRKI